MKASTPVDSSDFPLAASHLTVDVWGWGGVVETRELCRRRRLKWRNSGSCWRPAAGWRSRGGRRNVWKVPAWIQKQINLKVLMCCGGFDPHFCTFVVKTSPFTRRSTPLSSKWTRVTHLFCQNQLEWVNYYLVGYWINSWRCRNPLNKKLNLPGRKEGMRENQLQNVDPV